MAGCRLLWKFALSHAAALIVDPSASFGQDAGPMLLRAGLLRVETVLDAGEALTRIETGQHDGGVVVCDFDARMHDTVFLVRALAERRYTGRVVSVSAGVDPSLGAIIRLARQQGLDISPPVRKPLHVAEFMQALNLGASPAPALAMPGLLEAAISQGGLHPFFQPKVSMHNSRICGAEALARIATPETQYASPGPYVELAERNSRIDALTYAMTCAVARCAAGFMLDDAVLPVSINISPVSLHRADFPDVMVGAVEAQGLACDNVTLEVTGNRPEQYGAAARDVMARLRSFGFGLSIDDFGAGYANIDHLRLYPFSEVKIDAALIRQAMEERFAHDCLVSCVQLAHELDMSVVAEGVETVAMWRMAQAVGADAAQGYLLSKPLPPQALAELLARDPDLSARVVEQALAKSA